MNTNTVSNEVRISNNVAVSELTAESIRLQVLARTLFEDIYNYLLKVNEREADEIMEEQYHKPLFDLLCKLEHLTNDNIVDSICDTKRNKNGLNVGLIII